MQTDNTFAEPTCRKDNTKMEYVGNWADGDKDIALYQCPTCKAIIIKTLDLMAES